MRCITLKSVFIFGQEMDPDYIIIGMDEDIDDDNGDGEDQDDEDMEEEKGSDEEEGYAIGQVNT